MRNKPKKAKTFTPEQKCRTIETVIHLAFSVSESAIPLGECAVTIRAEHIANDGMWRLNDLCQMSSNVFRSMHFHWRFSMCGNRIFDNVAQKQ